MPRIFITGCTDGLGLMAADLLLKDGAQIPRCPEPVNAMTGALSCRCERVTCWGCRLVATGCGRARRWLTWQWCTAAR